jgi:hypothetical protein
MKLAALFLLIIERFPSRGYSFAKALYNVKGLFCALWANFL